MRSLENFKLPLWCILGHVGVSLPVSNGHGGARCVDAINMKGFSFCSVVDCICIIATCPDGCASDSNVD